MANSVFPVPVGPKKKKEAIGCPALLNPDLDSKIEPATVEIQWSWPITLWFNTSSMVLSFCFSSSFSLPAGIPRD